jgi:PleD family two-component response regulator
VGRPVSVGVALSRTGESATDTLRRADQAMYKAKQNADISVQLSA